MIVVHRPGARPDTLDRLVLPAGADLPEDALWIDLVDPSPEEDRLVEAHLGIEIPTRQEMADIEPSEILYREKDASYMTVRVICRSESEQPSLVDVSFILTSRALVTVRYDEPRSFAMFASRAVRPGGCRHAPEAVLEGLVETIIDRAAEVLGAVGRNVDHLSRSVFERNRDNSRARNAAFRGAMRSIGRKGDIISNVRESMASLERMLLFLSASAPKKKGAPTAWRTAVRDVQSIEEHATFLANKVQFLLDATIGLVTIDQNDIIKLFSVVAVIFLPPTLIASIYGMNFELMPELKWAAGYPFALVLMVLAGIAPYAYFRWKQWL
jgi:magnesium transporter